VPGTLGGNCGGEAGGCNSRNRADRFENSLLQANYGGRIPRLGFRDGDSQSQHVTRIESRIDAAQRLKCADHQSRADQQHQREGYLRHHQHTASAMALAALARGASAAAQLVLDSRTGIFDHRNHAEQNSCEERGTEM
jgi:hypothetical protein